MTQENKQDPWVKGEEGDGFLYTYKGKEYFSNHNLTKSAPELLKFIKRMADTRLVGQAQEEAYALIAKVTVKK